jgi:hypothetical protein
MSIFETIGLTWIILTASLATASVITSKAANGYHFKTGHSTNVRDRGFLLLESLLKQPTFRFVVRMRTDLSGG